MFPTVTNVQYDFYYHYFGKIKLYVNIMTAYIVIGECIGFLWLAEMYVWLRLLFLNDRWNDKRQILLKSVFTVDIKNQKEKSTPHN